jgi:hypothetical protein
MPAASLFGNRRHLRLVVAGVIASLSGCLLFGCARGHSDWVYGGPSTRPARIPLPKQTLLQPPREPGCTIQASGLPGREGQPQRSGYAPIRVANLAADRRMERSIAPTSTMASQPDSVPVQADPPNGLAQRIKLEYERDCFRRAEARVRHRLLRLQVAVSATVRAVKRAKQVSP